MGNLCFVPLQGGEINPVSVGNPAAGANWAYTLPAFYEQELRTLECKLTAAAVAGNRYPVFEILEPAGAVIVRIYFSVATTTGQISVLSLFVGCSRSDASTIVVGGNHEYSDALPMMRLLPGCVIQSNVGALNAADQFSEIRLLFHRFRV